MDRLTQRSISLQGAQKAVCAYFDSSTCWQFAGHCSEGCPYEERAWERLAAYEDTCLEPGEVNAAKYALMGQEIAKITEFDGVPIDHIRALVQAEKDGRLLVLPCKGGDTLWQRSPVTGEPICFEAPDIPWIVENLAGFGKAFFLHKPEEETT